MIKIKNTQEIEIMHIGGKILSETMRELIDFIKPGVSEKELDKLAEALIVQKGGEPGFKKVDSYDYTLCVSTNDQVVHGLPTDYIFKENDVVGIDCGVFYKGFFTDMSKTLRVLSQKSNFPPGTRFVESGKNQKDEIDRFLDTGKKALKEAIKVARPGNRVGHISKIIQDTVEGAGYSVVRSLVGHGVGKKLHEEPEVPGFLYGTIDSSPVLKTGMTLAIEVIYNMGKHDILRSKNDNWTIITKDRSISATFEKTIAITKNGPLVLTE